MPLIDQINKLLDNCPKVHPNYEPIQIIAEIQRYASEILTPVIPDREVVEFLEKLPKETVKNPRPLSHYTDPERYDRGIKSEKLRRALIEHTYFSTIGYREYCEKGETLDRTAQRLFKEIPENATKAQREEITKFNKELVLLFSKDPQRAENEAMLCEKIMNDTPGTTKEEALEQIKIRRGQIVTQAAREASLYAEKISSMIDDNLPADELVKNYKQVVRAMGIISEAQNLTDGMEATKPYYVLSDEEKELFYELNRNLNDVTTAMSRVNMIANPIYEYVDIDALTDYVLDRNTAFVEDEYAEKFDNDEKTKAKRKEKDPEFYDRMTFSIGVDSYTQLLSDASFCETNKYDWEIEKTAHDNGLQSKDDLLFFEKDNNTKERKLKSAQASSTANNWLKEGKAPAVIAKYDRMVVVQNVKGTIKEVNPENIFNYGFRSYTNDLTEQRKYNDPWYHRSSDVFKNMRRAFEETERLGHLQSGADLQTALDKYNDLLNKTNIYLATKVNHDQRKWTLRHVDMANQFKKYAETKLEQLKMIQNCRNTKALFEGKTPEQKKALVDEFNKVAAQKDNAKQFEAAPDKWFIKRFDALSKEVKPSEDLKHNINTFKSEIQGLCSNTKGDALYENAPTFLQPKLGAMLGTLTLLELFKLDRNTRGSLHGGEIEKFFETPKLGDLTHISELYALKKTGHNYASNNDKLIENLHGEDYYERLSPEQFKEFVQNYNPKEVAKELADTIYAEHGLSFAQLKFEGKFLNSIKPLRESTFNAFERELRNTVKTTILEPVSELLKNNEPLSADKTNELLTNAVLCSVILRERRIEGSKGPCYCERKMTEDPANIGDFRNMIAAMPEFDTLKANLVDENGCLKPDSLSALTDGNFAKAIVDAVIATEKPLEAQEVEQQVAERFPAEIAPVRGKENDIYEKKLSELVTIGINTALKGSAKYAVKFNLDTVDVGTTALILENFIIYDIVTAERKDTGADHPGYFENLIADDQDINALREDIEKSKEFKKLLADYANPNGEIDIKALADVINDNATQAVTQAFLDMSNVHEQKERVEAAASLDRRIKARFTEGIQPHRGEDLDECEKGLVNFAKEEIQDKIRAFIDSDREYKRFIDADTAKNIIGSCMVCMLAQNERNDNAQNNIDGIGPMEKAFGEDKNAVIALRDRVCKTKAFDEITKGYLTSDGKMSLQELQRFIENREPQNSVAAIKGEFAKEDEAKQAKNNQNAKAKSKAKQVGNAGQQKKQGGVIPGSAK